MNNDISIIQEAGLSENEAKVYYCLIKSKNLSVVEIAQQARLQRPTVYKILHRLHLINLVAKTPKGNRFVYNGVNPRRLLQLANLHKSSIENSLDHLQKIFHLNNKSSGTHVFEGYDAVLGCYSNMQSYLKEKNIIRIFGNIESVQNYIPSVVENFRTIISSKSFKGEVKDLMGKNNGSLDFYKFIKPYLSDRYQLRFAKDNSGFGFNEQVIVNDTIFLFSYAKDSIYALQITNSDLAKTQATMFDMAWEMSVSFDELNES